MPIPGDFGLPWWFILIGRLLLFPVETIQAFLRWLIGAAPARY